MRSARSRSARSGGASRGSKGCIPGVAEGFVRFGVVRRDEFAVDPPEVFGNWGGYFYNQLSLPRIMGVRMPGGVARSHRHGLLR